MTLIEALYEIEKNPDAKIKRKVWKNTVLVYYPERRIVLKSTGILTLDDMLAIDWGLNKEQEYKRIMRRLEVLIDSDKLELSDYFREDLNFCHQDLASMVETTENEFKIDLSKLNIAKIRTVKQFVTAIITAIKNNGDKNARVLCNSSPRS